MFFFFKQKTAYEMRISDWSSDVCSSDLKTIRYYESVGLIGAAERTASGYRVYGRDDVETLRFVQRARSLGFSVEAVGNLLTLWRDRSRSSAEVKALAERRVAEIGRASGRGGVCQYV